MEPKFGEILGRYNSLAKKEKQTSGDPEADVQLKREISRVLDAVVAERKMRPDAALQVLNLQREKSRVMDWLKSELKKLDSGEGQEAPDPNSRRIVPYGQGYGWLMADGTLETVSQGAILTDGIWGIEYDLSREVPRTLRKHYLIEKARRLLEVYLDHQLGIGQRRSKVANPKFRGGYSGLLKSRERLESEGHLAERMVYSFLKKISIDQGLPFEIENANVYEDIELKIDFLLKVKTKRRGIAVEGGEDVRKVGVQLTIGRGLRRKTVQVEEAKPEAKKQGIDDIVLVRLPLKELHRMFVAWSLNKPSGGPDVFWTPETKREILQGVFQGLFSDKEIEAMCSKVVPTNPFQEQT